MNNFLQSYFLKLTGHKICAKQEKILNCIFEELYTFKDDELEPPSSQVAVLTSACGQSLPQVLANSINCFGVYHGCFSDALEFILKNYKTEKNYYPGFGHPKYKENDPRVDTCLELVNKINYESLNINNSLKFAHDTGLPLNLGGFTACILLDCGCSVHNADLFPIICRSLGFTKIYEHSKINKIRFSSGYDIIKKYNSTNNI